MKFRTRFDERDSLETRIQRGIALTFDPKKARTKQSFREECDVNNLMKKYKKPELIPGIEDKIRSAQFLDTTKVPSFEDAQQRIAEGHNLFSMLPADIRYKFNNDPASFVDFASDADNMPALVKMGLATPRQPLKDGLESKNAASKGGKPQGSPKTPVEGRQAKPEGSPEGGNTSSST